MTATLSPLVETIKNTEALLHVGRTSIYRLVRSGELTMVKVGGRSMITTESILRLVGQEAA